MSSVSIRVGRDTLDRLHAFRDTLQAKVRANAERYKKAGLNYPIGISDAIDYLLYLQSSGRRAIKPGFDPGGRDKDKQGTDQQDEEAQG